MSTHNIGFYEDLTKIIFELSSNIIKYAPYFFCCKAPTQSEVKIAAWPKINVYVFTSTGFTIPFSELAM